MYLQKLTLLLNAQIQNVQDAFHDDEIESNFIPTITPTIMQILSDNPINFYTDLLHESNDLLDYWQEKLLTDKDTEWVEGKIKHTKIAIQGNYLQLEKLKCM